VYIGVYSEGTLKETTHSGYTFSFSTDMIMPLAVLLVHQIVTMNRKNKE